MMQENPLSLSNNHLHSDQQMNFDKIRRSLNILKLLDFVWFEDIDPFAPYAEIAIYINPDIILDERVIAFTSSIELSSHVVSYLTDKLKKPGWVNTISFSGKIRLAKGTAKQRT